MKAAHTTAGQGSQCGELTAGFTDLLGSWVESADVRPQALSQRAPCQWAPHDLFCGFIKSSCTCVLANREKDEALKTGWVGMRNCNTQIPGQITSPLWVASLPLSALTFRVQALWGRDWLLLCVSAAPGTRGPLRAAVIIVPIRLIVFVMTPSLPGTPKSFHTGHCKAISSAWGRFQWVT